jgi:hypothetical protein
MDSLFRTTGILLAIVLLTC